MDETLRALKMKMVDNYRIENEDKLMKDLEAYIVRSQYQKT